VIFHIKFFREKRKTTLLAVFRFMKCLERPILTRLHVLRLYQPPAPMVGEAVGLAAGAIGVGVALAVGLSDGLGVAGIGGGVMPFVGFGVPVGFVAGTVGVIDAPATGVVFVLTAGFVF
jgi:hypothetical protein